MRQTLIQVIAATVEAYHNCVTKENDWATRHKDTLRQIERDLLPSGSGMDNGTKIGEDRSNGDQIVLYTAFHHMDENGGYDGWTEHTIFVRPAFTGLDMKIDGRNRNDIKEYLYQTFEHMLTHQVEWNAESDRYVFAKELG